MKREIKLRAWNPKFGEMVYSNMDNEYQAKREWYPVCFEIGFSHYPHSIMDDETILMQFTGLLDKNGKKIYEGDILVFYKGYVDDSWTDMEQGRPYVMEWSQPDLGFRAKRENYTLVPRKNNWEWEVIGNIYENS